MSNQKYFRDLFGCDDSDEENVDAKLSTSYDKSKTKHGFRNKIDISKYKVENIHHKNNTKTRKLENGKRLNGAYEMDKKRIKKEHFQEFDKKTQESITDTCITDSVKGSKVSSPTETKCILNVDIEKKVSLKKTEIGGLVVKLLTPAYNERRFESRDTFKMLARNISHALYDKGEIILLN